MTSAKTYSDMIGETGPFSHAVDSAIEEINAIALLPEAEAEARAIGTRWAAILTAEAAAGEHAVVLPVALAKDVLAVASGEESHLPADLVIKMLAAQIEKVAK